MNRLAIITLSILLLSVTAQAEFNIELINKNAKSSYDYENVEKPTLKEAEQFIITLCAKGDLKEANISTIKKKKVNKDFTSKTHIYLKTISCEPAKPEENKTYHVELVRDSKIKLNRLLYGSDFGLFVSQKEAEKKAVAVCQEERYALYVKISKNDKEIKRMDCQKAD